MTAIFFLDKTRKKKYENYTVYSRYSKSINTSTSGTAAGDSFATSGRTLDIVYNFRFFICTYLFSLVISFFRFRLNVILLINWSNKCSIINKLSFLDHALASLGICLKKIITTVISFNISKIISLIPKYIL